jgi:hypothetical protein
MNEGCQAAPLGRRAEPESGCEIPGVAGQAAGQGPAEAGHYDRRLRRQCVIA